jgi:hypothetical protein
MTKWLRRIRGAIGMGLTRAAAWFGAGLILLLGVGFGAADVPFPLFFGLLGFLAGVTFSGVLGVIEGRRRLDQMSLPRFAGWGAVGGLLSPGSSGRGPWRGDIVGRVPGVGSRVRTGRCGLRCWFAGPGQNGGAPGIARPRCGAGRGGAYRRREAGTAQRR